MPRLILVLVLYYVRAEINTSSELNCDFSTDCRWRNSTDDNGEWILTNKLQIDPTHSILPMMGSDEGQFAVTQGFMGRTVAILLSDVVSCQLGGANIKYWYYKTGQTSQLELCIRQPPGSKEPASLRCYDGISSTHAQQWIFRIIELPPSSQPFELLFRATYYPPTDVIALDDVVFDAALCEIANDGANQGAGGGFGGDDTQITPSSPFLDSRIDEPSQSIVQLSSDHSQRAVNFAAPNFEPTKSTPPPSPRVGTIFKSMCPALDCAFDDGDFCNYITSKSTLEQDKPLKEWRLSTQGILNTLTGIPYDLSNDGAFLFAGGEDVSPRDTFVLSTKTPFTIKEPAHLDFFVYQAGIKGRLSVCLNTIGNCELILDGSNITNDSRKWKNYFVGIDANTNAIHFVADQLHKNYAIGLDNIQLLNRFGTSSTGC